MKILLCVDDIGWTPEATGSGALKRPDKGLALARRLHEALGGLPWLAGVIPGALDNEGQDWLRSAPAGLTVALHGFTHGSDRPDMRSEFDGCSEVEIRDRIAAGQGMVGPTPFYIPPYNACDPREADAMWHEGIRYIFGAPVEWPCPPSPHRFGKCWMFPRWSRIYGAVAWIQGGCEPLLDTCKSGFLDFPGLAVLTLHLPWEAARDPNFDHVKRLCGRIDSWTTTPQEFVRGYE